ncbi:MAG: acyltransferase [Pseudomonadota bacterium]
MTDERRTDAAMDAHATPTCLPRVYHPYLDGWRGIAIALLLIGHFAPVPGINLGQAGVNFFFVLSGLLMARILFIEKMPLATFYRRRISRIVPSVVVFIGVIVVLRMATGQVVSWTEVGAALAFLNNYFPGEPGAAVMPFGHIWSLCVEEHSYILLSLIALAARAGLVDGMRAIGTAALCMGASGIWYWLTYHGANLAFDRWLHTEVAAYGLFAAAYLALRLGAALRPARALPWLVFPALLGLGLALHWWSVALPLRTIGGVGAFAMCVALLARAPRLVHTLLSCMPLRQLGLYSFSLYLWQQPFYLAVDRLGLPTWAALVCALATGVAAFHLIEQPARRYLNRVWQGAGAPLPAPQGLG